jgi:hypothetical protein
MYCDQDEAVLTWGMFNPIYRGITKKPPWTLTDEERQLIEGALKACPFGGKFAFANPPLCPVCHRDISSVVPGGIYFVITGRRVDGDKGDIWV